MELSLKCVESFSCHLISINFNRSLVTIEKNMKKNGEGESIFRAIQ